ncbi:MAG: MFS transporter [Gammaproteobacteria bacterium]|nr:MFS transporter [Gammaproteobacteria bacterium]
MQKIDTLSSTLKKSSSITPWLIWATSAVFVLFQFFLQLSSGVIVEDLMKSFAINALGAGILSSTYYYVYVALQTPAGIFVDRFGPRKLLTGGAIICAVGCFLFASAKYILMAELGRLFMGAGSSFAFVGSLYLISQWFAVEKFALMVGIAETIGTIGTLVGNIFLASLLTNYGWRKCMMVSALIAILIGIASWLIIRDKPEKSSTQRPAIQTDTHFLYHTLQLLKSKKAWLNGIYSGLLFSVVTVFVALWGIPFLVKVHHTTITMATIMGSFVFLGLAVGCPIIGIFCNRIRNRNYLMAGCALVASILMTIILLATSLSIPVICVVMFFLGLVCSSYVINFAIAKELAPPEAVSTSIGFTNTLSVITAPLMQPLVGGILHLMNHSKTLSGIEIYSVFDYQVALFIVPIGLIAAAIIALYID